MEFTLRTVVIMILLVVMALVIASIIASWNSDSQSWFSIAHDTISKTLLGE